MSSIIIPRKWQTQPQYPVALNPDIDTRFLYLPSVGKIDLVNKNFASSTTGLIIPNSGGLALYDDTASSALDFPASQRFAHVVGQNVTVVVFTKYVHNTASNQTLISAAYESDTIPIYLDVRSGTSMQIGSYSGSNSAYGNCSFSATGKDNLIVAGFSGSTKQIFIDQVEQTLTTGGVALNAWGSNSEISVGRVGNGINGRRYSGFIYLAAVVWEAPNIVNAKLDGNPWQIFRKQPQVLYFDVGGGETTLTPSLYVDGDTFYAATVSAGAVTLTPSLYSDGDTFYAATVTLGGAAQGLTPALFTDGDTFHTATVAAGSVNLAPSLVTDDDTFYAATVSQTGATQELTPALFIDAPHTVTARPDGTIDGTGFTPVGAATIHECLNEVTPNDSTYIVGTSDPVEVSLQDIADPGISTGHVVRYRAKADNGWSSIVLLQGATTIASKSFLGTFPTTWTDDSFTLTAGEADSITDYTDLRLRFTGLVGNIYYSWAEFSVDTPAGDTFHSATVAAGAVTLSPSLVSDGDTFYTHALVLDGGPQTLSPDLFADGDTFHAATVTPGAVTLTPSLYTDADTFHAAEIASGFNLQPPAYADPDTFYPATVAAGAVSLSPALFVDGDAFHAPAITFGQVLAPSLFTDADIFHSPVVYLGDLRERLERIFHSGSDRRIFTVAFEQRIFKD